jgi:cytochrome c oxidase subunit IV
MIMKIELIVLSTLTALLGMVSRLAVFFTQMEWYVLAPILVCVYPALTLLLFLTINSFESRFSTCLKYVVFLSYYILLHAMVTRWVPFRV